VIYIFPITNQCLSKCGTFITTRDETNADVALNCFSNYMTQTFLPIRTNYDFNKLVNLACQNLILLQCFSTCKTYLSPQNTVLARTKVSGTRETQGEKNGAKWDSVNITGLHQTSRENTPSVNLRLKKRLIQQRMAVGISKKKTRCFEQNTLHAQNTSCLR
jgi:hypothetical protein